jgi:glutathione S-transferase
MNPSTPYGSRGSGSAAVEMALRAADQPCTVVRASTWEDDSAQAELQGLNPLGQIPTLVLPIEPGARAQLHRAWELFADGFPARPWLAGAAPGALDFLAVVVARWSEARAHLQRTRPDFHALPLRLQAHDAVAPVWRAYWDD